jgi:5-methylthioadenosine/S-adenosylhomocysteine deaminase
MGSDQTADRKSVLEESASTSSGAARYLIRDASLVLTMDPNLGEGVMGLLTDSDVLIEHDRIAAVGQNLPAHGAKVVHAAGKIVMPGFVDTHNHLWQSIIRGCGCQFDVVGWLTVCPFPLRDNPILTPTREETQALVRLSTLDLLDTGVTTVVDWSHAFTPDFVRGNLDALRASGLRFVYVYNGSSNPTTLQDIPVVKQMLVDPHPRAAGFHVGARPFMPVTGSTTFEVLLDLARNLGVKVNSHVLENSADRAGDPMQALHLTGALGPDLLLNHMVHVTDPEMALLAANDVRLTHNPVSNMRLASGTMRLPDFHQAGIKVGLGTDGPGTNDNSNFFDVMRIAVGLQRVKSLQATGYPTVPDVLRMATLGGAELLDLGAQIGSLTPGKKADLLILNPATTNFASGLNWVNQIVFSAAPTNVDWVFVDGRPLKKRGKLVDVQPAAVIAAAEAATARIRQDWIAVGTFPE